MGYFCNECGKTISEEVHRFSKDHYSRALCMEHQPKPANKSHYKKPEPTPQALKLGNLLKSMGHKVEFEKYDGYKHIDIAIVDKKVNIEVDGGQHQGKVQALRDLKRTFYSWNKSFVTLRIPNSLTKEETIEETAKYIDKFLRKDRAQLEKEIKEEYIEEGNPIWEDMSNFINDFVGDVGKAWGNLSKIINS
jgi:very-short-patch-repair endonuclease